MKNKCSQTERTSPYNFKYSLFISGRVAEKIAESNELMNEENKEVLTVFQKNTSLNDWH